MPIEIRTLAERSEARVLDLLAELGEARRSRTMAEQSEAMVPEP